MSDSDSEEYNYCMTPEIEMSEPATSSLLQPKSETQYEQAYQNFIENMSDSDSEEFNCIPPEIEINDEAGKAASSNLLPPKSKAQYERAYQLFMDWRQKTHTDSFSENVLLTYFQNLSASMKPSSLWAIYSMLRTTINMRQNINIAEYNKLRAFLKRFSNGYKPKTSKVLTPEQIRDFLSTAPDEKYLFTKVSSYFIVQVL